MMQFCDYNYLTWLKLDEKCLKLVVVGLRVFLT
jgi:hypothetical protein